MKRDRMVSSDRDLFSYSFPPFYLSLFHLLSQDGEAHVVAGARAMMRYRNNKSVDGTAATGGAGVAGAAALVAASGGASGMKGWSSGGAATTNTNSNGNGNGGLSGGIAAQGQGVGKYPAVGGATTGAGAAFQTGQQQRTSAPKVKKVYIHCFYF